MRLLREVCDREQLRQLRHLLESKGIPVFVEPSGPGVGQPGMPGYQPMEGVWVCLEEQFEDAVALLQNPHHKVSEPVDVQDFYRRLEKAEHEVPLSTPVMVAIIFAALAVLVFAFRHA